jgi:hypothetical protein
LIEILDTRWWDSGPRLRRMTICCPLH